MPREEEIVFGGEVLECLPNANFKIKLENDMEIIAYTAGRMKKNRIKVLAGDYVKVIMTTYDLTKGRVDFRFKSKIEYDKWISESEAE